MVFDLNKDASRVSLENSKLKTKPVFQRTKTTTSITDSNFLESPQHKHKATIESPRRIPQLQALERTKSVNIDASKKVPTLQVAEKQKSYRDYTKADKVSFAGNMHDTAESMSVKLEEWLSSDDLSNYLTMVLFKFPLDEIPLIAKDAYVHNTIKNQGNFEIILSFIFDPLYYTIGDCVSPWY